MVQVPEGASPVLDPNDRAGDTPRARATRPRALVQGVLAAGLITGVLAGIVAISGFWLLAQYTFHDPVSRLLLSSYELGFQLSGVFLIFALVITMGLTHQAFVALSTRWGRVRLVLALLGATTLGLTVGAGLVMGMEALNDAGVI